MVGVGSSSLLAPANAMTYQCLVLERRGALEETGLMLISYVALRPALC